VGVYLYLFRSFIFTFDTNNKFKRDTLFWIPEGLKLLLVNILFQNNVKVVNLITLFSTLLTYLVIDVKQLSTFF
jgi:F0F1-type ATP synthase assembly protein I